MIEERARGLGLVVASVLVLGCSARKGAGDETGAGESTESTESTGLTPEDVAGTGSACEPILQEDGAASGFEQCMDGELIRTSPQTCTDPYPPSSEHLCMYGTCFADEDCKEAPHGVCQLKGDVPPICDCEYGCIDDADCGPGFACMCAPVYWGTRCIEADCRSEADCSGYRCTLAATWWGTGLRCHSAFDDCQVDADCPDGSCTWNGFIWTC